jgi:AcrR family transcriptional regulator
MNERRTEILIAAIGLIADEGYASLSMRALARVVGMKLGSLQYHFRSSDELLKAIVGFVSASYDESFAELRKNTKQNPRQNKAHPSLEEIVAFVMDDKVGANIVSDKLWPQLWAMQQVEPLVSDLVDNIYSTYLKVLEQALRNVGASAPRAEALILMSMLEGSTIFLGEGRRWQKDGKAVRRSVLEYIEHRYGETTS